MQQQTIDTRFSLPEDKHVTGQLLTQWRNSKNFRQISNYLENNYAGEIYKIYVLYPDETIAYELTEHYLIKGGNYNENYQNGQRRTLSFTLLNQDGSYTPNINMLWAGTKIKLEVGITLENDQVLWFDKGIYIIQSVTPSAKSNQKTVAVQASDKFSIFEGPSGTVTDTYKIGVGADIKQIIEDVLLIDNGSGDPYDPQPIIYNQALDGKTVQSEITIDAGGKYSKILMDLATQLSAEIFYDASGRLNVIPLNEASLDIDKPLLYDYSTHNGTIAGLDFNINYNQIINRVIVVGGTSRGSTPCHAIASNDDANSPLCVQRIGARVGNVIRDTNITTPYLAKERADYELRQYLIVKSSTSATVAFNPFLEVNNLITISDTFFQLSHARFLLQGVSFSLNYSGQMSITFSNLNNLPFLSK